MKTYIKQFQKLLAEAKKSGENNSECSCCGGKLPPTSVYEIAREWDCDSGDCTGSVQPENGRCNAFSRIGW